MIKRREIAISIILTIFTCGIYGIFWFISLTDDIKTASEDQSLPSGGVAFLLTLVTCGIYGFYWAYRMGKALAAAQTRAGFNVTNDSSILYLILQIFGFAIINYALMQNQLNNITDRGNNTNSQQPNGYSNGNMSQQSNTYNNMAQQPAAPVQNSAAPQAPADHAQPVITESIEETTITTEEQ